ncbi:MAG: FG-GAP-like repeat-containing protein [Bacteroidota bacterium]
MQKHLLAILAVTLCLLQTNLYAQDPTWYTDVSDQVGLQTTPQALRLNVVDINGDKYPDIVSVQATNLRDMINVYLNVQDTSSLDPLDRMFIDWTDSSGVNIHPDYLDSTRRSEIVSLADVDNDGDVDMVSGIWHWDPAALNFPNDRASVLLNDGSGRFSHVANNGFDALGLISIAGFSFLDFNYDGFLDVFVATFSDDHPNNAFREDHMMVGNGDGTFTLRPSPFDLDIVRFPNYGASVTDWNNDCYQDILTSPYCRSGGNLWRNIAGGSFQDVSTSANYSAQHMQGDTTQGIARDLCQWGVYPYDFDNDGDMDMFQSLVHGGLGPTEGRSTIAVNAGASNSYILQWDFTLLTRGNPMSTHLGNMDATWGDINNDGLVDLIVTETEYQPATDRGFWYIQDSTHHFTDYALPLGHLAYRPHTIESVDYDLDGDYDLIFNDRDDGTQIRVLRNDIGNQNNWLGINLDAPAAANADAIGARIQLFSGGVTQMREVQAGLGHWGGQAPFLQIFGIGQETIIDSVIVRWPMQGCLSTTIYNPPINEFIEINESGMVVAQEEPRVEGFELFPNPAQSAVTLRGPDFTQEGIAVQVYNSVGALVEMRDRQQLASDKLRFSVANFPAGVYIVQVVDQTAQKRWTKKLIVQ